MEHIAQSRQNNTQQEVETQERLHLFFDGPTYLFKYQELIDDWLDLTVLKKKNDIPH